MTPSPTANPDFFANLTLKSLVQMVSQSGRATSVRGKVHREGVLCQGTTLVVPQKTEDELGFSPCGLTASLIVPEGAWGFSPTKNAQRMRGFSPGLRSFRNVHHARSANPTFRAPSIEGHCA
jgi:hypothetical protein